MMVSPASYHNEQFPCLRGGPFFILDGIVPPRFELCTAAHGAQEDVSVKRSFAVLALFSAGFLAAQDRVAPPAGLAPMVQPADTSVCADVKDAENYCVWDSAKGTHGRNAHWTWRRLSARPPAATTSRACPTGWITSRCVSP